MAVPLRSTCACYCCTSIRSRLGFRCSDLEHGCAGAQAHNGRPPPLRGPGWSAALGLLHAGMVVVPGDGCARGREGRQPRWERVGSGGRRRGGAAVVRLGLCICKRVLDMGWISRLQILLGPVWNAGILQESHRNFTEISSISQEKRRKNVGIEKNPAFQTGP